MVRNTIGRGTHGLAPFGTERVGQRDLLVGVARELAERQTHGFFILHHAHADLQRTRLRLHQLVVAARIVTHDHIQVADDLVVTLEVGLLGLQQFLVAQGAEVMLGHGGGQILLRFHRLVVVELLVELVTLDARGHCAGREQVEPAGERHRIRIGQVLVFLVELFLRLHAQHRPVAAA